MMGWIAFGVTAVATIVLAVALHRRNQEALELLRGQQADEVSQLRSEARGKLDRLQRESDKQRNTARDGLLEDLLPSLDALTLARAELGDDDISRGVDLAVQDLSKVLAKHGVSTISAEPGDLFDPNVHEAVETYEDPTLESGTVGRCHRPGWRADERVIRPALVGVVRNPSAATEEE